MWYYHINAIESVCSFYYACIDVLMQLSAFAIFVFSIFASSIIGYNFENYYTADLAQPCMPQMCSQRTRRNFTRREGSRTSRASLAEARDYKFCCVRLRLARYDYLFIAYFIVIITRISAGARSPIDPRCVRSSSWIISRARRSTLRWMRMLECRIRHPRCWKVSQPDIG
jgi:hypothetical protein